MFKYIIPLLQTSEGGALCPPSDVCVRRFLCPSFTLIKLPPHKSPEWSRLVSGPEAKCSSLEIKNTTSFTVGYQIFS